MLLPGCRSIAGRIGIKLSAWTERGGVFLIRYGVRTVVLRHSVSMADSVLQVPLFVNNSGNVGISVDFAARLCYNQIKSEEIRGYTYVCYIL